MEKLINPLLNPEILSMIFDRCDVQDLPSVRRVSKLWRRECLATWRARNRYFIRDDKLFPGSSQSQALTQLDKLLPLLSTPELAESCYRLQSKPPRNIVVHGWDFSENVGPKLEFWNSCGSWIKWLSLTYSNFPEFRVMEDILFRQTPNLEQLILRENTGPGGRRPLAIHDGDGDDALVVPQEKLKAFFSEIHCIDFNMAQFPATSWARIFKHYPNLKKLGFEFIGWSSLAEVEAYMNDLHQLLLTIRDSSVQPRRRISLKELDIFNPKGRVLNQFPPESAALFQELRLPLETLKVDIGMDTPKEVANQLLASHSETLRHLVCFRGTSTTEEDRDHRPLLLSYFPFEVYFGYLQNLELMGRRLVSDFNFLNFTPNLKRLAIYLGISKGGSSRCNNFTLHVMERDWAATRLDCLEQLEGDFEVGTSWDAIAALGDWMPNLRRLNIPLDQFTFPAVCRTWNRTLRELQLQPKSRVDDATLTGIPAEILEQQEESSAADASTYPLKKRKSNITNLEALETFSYNAQNSSLTDHSVEFGFSALSNLHTLHVRFFRPLSFENERILKDGVANLQIFCGGNERISNSP